MQQQDRSIRWRREGARDSLDSVLIRPSLDQRAPPSIDASRSFFLNQPDTKTISAHANQLSVSARAPNGSTLVHFRQQEKDNSSCDSTKQSIKQANKVSGICSTGCSALNLCCTLCVISSQETLTRALFSYSHFQTEERHSFDIL